MFAKPVCYLAALGLASDFDGVTAAEVKSADWLFVMGDSEQQIKDKIKWAGDVRAWHLL